MEGEEEMNVLFLRFIDRILNMIDEPVVLFDKELNPVRANASGWRFFDTCKNRPSFLCEGCPVRRAKEAGLPCTKRCNQGIVQSEPLRNADGAMEGVVITLLGPHDRDYKLEEIDWDLTES
ncbi:MAG TPA: hypothetical protein ACFYEA_07230 [Candidatus Tripitaka californicus]|uniref:hypothetical protein n=1 Tax=Candidatus Tripitaka californicus TaxID=3367616 RepID=UPI0040288988|nr:hypothetical protein [Planctomycetota bacterium]